MPTIAKRLALGVMVLAAFAVNASAASAVLFHKTNMGNTVLTGSQETQNVFTIPEGAVKCEVATFAGETEETSPETVTVTPKYEKCEFAKLGKNSATVSMNGCDYAAYANGEAGLNCPEGKSVTIVSSLAGVTKCTITVAPQSVQTGLKTLKYTNNADGTVTASAEVIGIKYSTKKGTGTGACEETSGGTEGTLTGSVKVGGAISGVSERIWVE